jgi:hypothetical protein
MKTIKCILLGFLVSFSTIFCQNAFSQFPKTDTIIKEDSMNLAIFIVDFMTYQFESVNISYYTKCNNYCESDSLPILMYFDSWWDDATVYFYYKFDSSLLFKAGIHWMGTGQIEYPTNFVSSQNFPYVSNPIPLPEDAEYYNTTIVGNYCTLEEYKQRAQIAWHSIDSLELTNIFAEKQFRVGLYGYSRTEGLFNPYNADWIIFLYRGNADPPFSVTNFLFPSFNLYPNPGNGKFTFDGGINPQKIQIFNFFGKKLSEISTLNTKNIDISYLPDGIYFLKIFLKSGIGLSKVSIIH